MTLIEQLELPLWEFLREASLAPDAADLKQLLTMLDDTLADLDTVGGLQVAAEAIAQIVQVFQERSVLTFEELEATHNDDGPVMPEDAFDRYVRQSMEVDFDQFIEPLERLPRKLPERLLQSPETGSVVGELDKAALLQALDEQLSQYPGLTEAEAFNQTMELAHDEDVSTWAMAIADWMTTHQIATIPLLHLQEGVGMPLVQVWLTLLLGGFAIEQRGEFYQTAQLWVLTRR